CRIPASEIRPCKVLSFNRRGRKNFTTGLLTRFATTLVIRCHQDVHMDARMALTPTPESLRNPSRDSSPFENRTGRDAACADLSIMQLPGHQQAQDRQQMRKQLAVKLDGKREGHTPITSPK